MTRARLLTAATLLGAGATVALGRSIVRRRRAERQTIGTELLAASECEALHAAKVERIAAQLRAHDGTKPVSLRKKAPPHQVPKGGDLRRKDAKIDLSDLTQIIHVDPVNQIC